MNEHVSTRARTWVLAVVCGCGGQRAPVSSPAEAAPSLVVQSTADELLLRRPIWTLDERRRDAPVGVVRWHVYDVQRSAISSHSSTFPSDGALLVAFAGVPLDSAARYAVIDDVGFVGIATPTSDPTLHARIVGGLFARPLPNGIALPLGDAVLYRLDLDGDRRSELEARSRDCRTTDIDSAHAELCIEIVRREGTKWRVIARALHSPTHG